MKRIGLYILYVVIGIVVIVIGYCGILRLNKDEITKYNNIFDNSLLIQSYSEKNSINEYDNKYFTAFGTEPYWNIEISGGIAKFSSPMYDTNVSIPVNIRKEGDDYYFTGEEIEGEFIKKDCLDGGKGDLHYYTVGISKFRDYYYEGCGDDEEGIKMSDEEYEATIGINSTDSSEF